MGVLALISEMGGPDHNVGLGSRIVRAMFSGRKDTPHDLSVMVYPCGPAAS
jgi:hypothetical protein